MGNSCLSAIERAPPRTGHFYIIYHQHPPDGMTFNRRPNYHFRSSCSYEAKHAEHIESVLQAVSRVSEIKKIPDDSSVVQYWDYVVWDVWNMFPPYIPGCMNAIK